MKGGNMYCTKCGKEITNNSKFCKYCGNENMKKKQTTSEVVKVVSIVVIVISILSIYNTIKDTKSDIQHRNKQAEEITATKYTFNCLYCKAYISIKEKDLIEYSNEYSGFCPNCHRSFDIDKKTHKVKLNPKY